MFHVTYLTSLFTSSTVFERHRGVTEASVLLKSTEIYLHILIQLFLINKENT